MATYTEDFRAAKKYFDQGEYSEALGRFQSLSKIVRSKSEEGQLRALIAASLMNIGGDENLAASIKMYKTITTDYTLLPLWRAIAFLDIASIISTRCVAFYESNFPEEPYTSFLPLNGTEDSRVGVAYKKLLELSDETFPTSYAEYRLAGYYSGILLRGNFAPSPENIEAAELGQKYVVEGDTRKDRHLFPPSVVLQNYLERAFAISGGANVLKNKTAEERDAAYRLIFSAADSLHQDSLTGLSARTLLVARFHYATFLLNNFPNPTEEISRLLKPYEHLDSNPPTPFMFKDISSQSENSFARTRSIALARVSPEFKGFLGRLGLSSF